MALTRKHQINVHTSTGTTAPTGASLYLGEIAVQHTPDEPALWIKMGTAETSTDYEKFIGETEITQLINSNNALGSGYTYSGIPYVNSSTTFADAYSALTNEVINDEYVITQSLNDLNDRIKTISGSTSDIGKIREDLNAVSGVVDEISDAVVDIYNIIDELSGNTDLSGLSASVITLSAIVEDNEVVVAQALNILKDRIDELSGNTGGGSGAVTAVTITGTGNAVTNATFVDSALTLTKGDVQEAIADLTDIRNGALSGTSAYTNVLALSASVKEHEYVTAQVLNDLNNRIIEISGNTGGGGEDVAPLSAAVISLSAATTGISSNVTALSAATTGINANLTALSASTTGINANLTALSAATTGINATLTAHTGNTALHLPTVTSSDNSKVLKVVEGAWTVVNPINVYAGTGEPSPDLGQNGDIYLETGGATAGPSLRMVYNGLNYTNGAVLVPLSTYYPGMTRTVEFYVDGETITSMNDAQDIADPNNMISPTQDSTTGVWSITFTTSDTTGTYFVEAYIDGSNDPVTGVIYLTVFNM